MDSNKRWDVGRANSGIRVRENRPRVALSVSPHARGPRVPPLGRRRPLPSGRTGFALRRVPHPPGARSQTIPVRHCGALLCTGHVQRRASAVCSVGTRSRRQPCSFRDPSPDGARGGQAGRRRSPPRRDRSPRRGRDQASPPSQAIGEDRLRRGVLSIGVRCAYTREVVWKGKRRTREPRPPSDPRTAS